MTVQQRKESKVLMKMYSSHLLYPYTFLLIAAAKGMYSHHRYLKSPFLRSKKSQEEAQLLPEVGLARKHTRNMDDGVAMVSLHYSNQYNFRVHGNL